MTRRGIDVSHWQVDVNWSKVRQAGYDFAYIKATEGSAAGTAYVDPYLVKNAHGANDNGVDAGAYHFAKFVSVNDAIAEAEWFVQHIKGLPLTLPPALDLEENNCPSYDIMNQSARAFMEYVEKEMGACIFYSMGNFFRDHVDKGLLKDFGYWHARYAPNPINMDLKDLFAWQYSDKGEVPGISGKSVDLNLAGGKFFLNPKNNIGAKKPTPTVTKPEADKTTPYYVTAETLNIRQKPDADSKDIGDLHKGDRVQVISISNGWAKIKSNNTYVYVSSDYISKTKPSTAVYYVVKKGDNLTAIAKNFGTSVSAIQALNGLKNPNMIYPGQRLRVK